MSKMDFTRSKALLKQKEAELTRGRSTREALAVQKSADLLEEVQLASERELAVRTADRDAHLLRQVRAALERLEDGSYGICQRCDQPIPARRLEALPWAAYCVKCQEIIDRDGEDVEAPHHSRAPLMALAA